MLSILIPVFNYDVTTLVLQLLEQGKLIDTDFEILIFDDGSCSAANLENEKLNSLEKVQFTTLEKNVGLAQNRNLLAKAAQFEQLIFIDGDSLIQKNFLKNYLDAMESSSEIIYGGRVHPENYPDKNNLRWKYGTFVEDKKAMERKKDPFRALLFNNTLIKKNVFEKVGFEKNLTKYGHEDTLFSYQLRKMNCKVQHIDNPVIHGDIDANEVFLKKTQKGLENLKTLCQSGMMDSNYVKLSNVHNSLKKVGLDKVSSWIFSLFEKSMRKNLTSKKPSLMIFTIFRLTYFCKISN